MAKKEKAYKTIRIYAEDHNKLLQTFSREYNLAEIIHQLVEKMEQKK